MPVRARVLLGRLVLCIALYNILLYATPISHDILRFQRNKYLLVNVVKARNAAGYIARLMGQGNNKGAMDKTANRQHRTMAQIPYQQLDYYLTQVLTAHKAYTYIIPNEDW